MKLPPNVPTRTVQLDRERTIALNFPAYQRLKALTGSLEFDVEVEDMLVRLPQLVWSALVDGDREDLEPEDVAAMLHMGNVPEIVEAIGALGKGEEGNVQAPAEAAP